MTPSEPDDDAPVVYVVDDDAGVRQSLDNLLRSVGWHTQTFASTSEFSASYYPQRASCLLLDVRLRGESGLVFQQRKSGDVLSPPIIVMTGFADVEMCKQAMKAGATDFLVKPFLEQQVIDAVTHALVVDRVRRSIAKARNRLQEMFELLTPREKQVFSYVVSGAPNKRIATSLDLSVITIKIHRASVMRKMDASSLADLVRKAAGLELTMENDPERSFLTSLLR
jgi:FixJ family two-component response regulator